MANLEHLEILKQGVDAWNRWRAENRDVRPDISHVALPASNWAGIDFSLSNLEGVSVKVGDFSGVSFQGAFLSGSSFIDSDFENADFVAAVMENATFNGSNFVGARFIEEEDSIGADFRGASLRNVDMSEVNLENSNFESAVFDESMFRKSNLKGANLWYAQINDADFWMADLSGATLGFATLCNSDFEKARFDKADLAHAKLLDTDFCCASLKRASLKNATLTESDFREASFLGADMQGVIIRGGRFERATLNDVNLRKSSIFNVVFNKSRVENIIFASASLDQVDFSECSLVTPGIGDADPLSSTFRGAELEDVRFSGAHLDSVDFRDARLREVNFSQAELFNALFVGAEFQYTTFSSKRSLNSLKAPLATVQLLGISFVDEEGHYRKKGAERTEFDGGAEGSPCIRIYIDTEDWTPYDLSLFLMGFQLSINRIQFLLSTHEEKLEVILHELRTAYPEFSHNIRLTGIQDGSMEFWASFLEKRLPPWMVNTLMVGAAIYVGAWYTISNLDDHQLKRLQIEEKRIELLERRKGEVALSPSGMSVPSELVLPNVPVNEIRRKIVVPPEFAPKSSTVEDNAQELLSHAVEPITNVLAQAKQRGASTFQAETGIRHADGRFEAKALTYDK